MSATSSLSSFSDSSVDDAPATRRPGRLRRFPNAGQAVAEALLAYRAPFLIEKLRKNRMITTDEEGEALFYELKRYVVLHLADPTRLWQMHSIRIDEVWHEFVLFTREYQKFCLEFVGGYFPHAPSNAPKYPSDEASADGDLLASIPTLAEFKAHYEATFGEPLPLLWTDDMHVTLGRRLITNEDHGRLVLATDDARVELSCDAGDHHHVYLRVDAWAEPSLRFILDAGTFYVREIPGQICDDDRVDLGRALVRSGAARLGS